MAINNTVKTNSLKGIGDPNQGFGSGIFQPKKPAQNLSSSLSTATTGVTTPKKSTGLMSTNAGSQQGQKAQPGLLTPPVVNKPPVNPNQGQIDAITGQIKSLQGQVDAARGAGYQPGQEIKKDAQGNVIPVTPAKPANTFDSTTQALATFDPTKQPGYIASQTAYQQKVNELENLKKDYAEKTTQIQGRPGSNLTLASGQQGLLNQQYLSAESAAQGAVNQQQQAIGQALTATGQQQGALTSAAGLVQPQQVSPSTMFADPRTGNRIGDPGGAVNQSIYGQNINDLGSLVSKSNEMDAQYGSIKNLETRLTNTLGIQGGLNPTVVPAVNSAIRRIMTAGVGDPNYQSLQTLILDLSNQYSKYLGSGGTVTDSVRDAGQSLINGNASPEAIITVLQGLDGQMQDVISGINYKIQKLKSDPYGTTAPTQGPGSAPAWDGTWENLPLN